MRVSSSLAKFILAATAALCAGCSSMSPTDRASEAALIAKSVGISTQRVELVSRCEFSVTPVGTLAGRWRIANCALVTDGELHIRPIDLTTGESIAGKVYKAPELISIGIHEGLILDQLQLRVGEDLIAIHTRPDSGSGLANAAARQIFDGLARAGVKVVVSRAAVQFDRPATTTVPIFIPVKK